MLHSTQAAAGSQSNPLQPVEEIRKLTKSTIE